VDTTQTQSTYGTTQATTTTQSAYTASQQSTAASTTGSNSAHTPPTRPPTEYEQKPENQTTAATTASTELVWSYVLMDEARRCYASLSQGQIGKSQQWMKDAYDKASWGTGTSKPTGPLSNCIAWYTEKNCGCTMSSDPIDPNAALKLQQGDIPEWLGKIQKSIMSSCEIMNVPNSCEIVYLGNGQAHWPWHSDNQSIFASPTATVKDTTMILVTLGQRRMFQFRPIEANKEDNINSVFLEDGSILVMSGLFQTKYIHQIAHEPTVAKPTVFLIFRWVINHGRYCRVQAKQTI